MTLIVIDWERKTIEEIETECIKYGKATISYCCNMSSSIKSWIEIPYQNFLGIKKP